MVAVPIPSFSVMPPVRGGTGLPESVMILGLVLTVSASSGGDRLCISRTIYKSSITP